MRQLQLSGAVVPHAPVLLEEVAGRNSAAGSSLRAVVGSIDLGVGAAVIASPHGKTTGVYRRAAGGLDGLGPRGISVEASETPFTAALARTWGKPLLDPPADHGVVVPMKLLRVHGPVVAVAFAEGAPDDDGLADALRAAGFEGTFVASANLSAGLDERSPVPSIEGAADVDAAVVRALEHGPRDLTGMAGDLARASSCAAGPLAAFGSLFGDASCEVLAYEHPFGVGHVVAVTR